MPLDDTDVPKVTDAARPTKMTGYLQICDDGVLHILFLFLQEVETHGVQSVRAQFVVPEENLGETERKVLHIQKPFPQKMVFPKWMQVCQCGCC